MKKNMNVYLYFITLIFSIFSSINVVAGNEGGHGGDTIALEFRLIGDIINQELSQLDDLKLRKLNFSKSEFEKAYKSVRVVSAPGYECKLNYEEVDAINFPEQSKIKVNSDRWVQKNIEAKVRLVFHEYLGIIGAERDSFEVTNQLLEFLSYISNLIRKKESLQSMDINLFYGKCQYFPSVSSTSICDVTAEGFKLAQVCANNQAAASCRLGGREGCETIDTKFTPVIRTDLIGLRYCEILTIKK